MTNSIDHPAYGMLTVEQDNPLLIKVGTVEKLPYYVIDGYVKTVESLDVDDGPVEIKFTAPPVEDRIEEPVSVEVEDCEYFNIEDARRHLESVRTIYEDGERQQVKAEDATPENVINLDTSYLDKVLSDTDELGTNMMRTMLGYGAMLHMSHDKAAAHTEASLNDGLGVEGSISGEMVHLFDGFAKIELASLALSKSKHIPKAIKQSILEKLSETILGHSFKEIAAAKSQVLQRRYSDELENPVGKANSIGTVRSMRT